MRNLRRFLFITIAVLVAIPSSYAVLKERDLSRTLGVLKSELEADAKRQEKFMERYKTQHMEMHNQLIDYMKRCEQIGLMLYSQKSDFTFDVAFACQQATDLYKELQKTNVPYGRIKERIQMDVDRYDSLISILEALPPSINDKEEMFEMDSLMKDSMARIDSVLFDSLGADSLLQTMPMGASPIFGVRFDSLTNESIQKKAPVAKADTAASDSFKPIKREEPFVLSEEEQKDRLLCVDYAKTLRDNLLVFLKLLEKDSNYYVNVSQHVEKLNAYAQSRYKFLQQSIYKNGGTNYFKILLNIPRYFKAAMRDISDKYKPFPDEKSEWRGPIILGVSIFMIIYIVVAILLSNLIMRTIPWFTRKFFPKTAAKFEERITRKLIDKEEMDKKFLPITIALGIFIFGLVISIIRGFLWGNLLIMAVSLMITVAWLFEAVVISLIIRLNGSQVRAGLKIYLPFLVTAFIVVLFRIVLLPNSIINLVYPAILLLLTIWQFRAHNKYKNELPLSDSAYASVSMGAMVVACGFAWFGYTLVAVQIIMWWMFQLAAIQTITCVYDLLLMYEKKYIVGRIMRSKGLRTESEVMEHASEMDDKTLNKALARARNDQDRIMAAIKRGDYFTKTWLYDFIYKTGLPILCVISVMLSIHWAANIFEMASTVKDIYLFNFVDQQYLQLSLFKLSLVLEVFFLFRFINYGLKSYYYHWYRRAKSTTEGMNETLVKNIIAILVWGGFFVFALILLQVPSGGIAIVTTGLATGMGFAMKDLLENFFYGISLMTGRVRVGDFIECDGIQGRVESITYQSTQIETIDGSVMAFLNSALFNKNFKNLTRNNNYILVLIPVGVAYGSNIKEVRQIILDAIKPLAEKTPEGRYLISPRKEITVAFSEFGESSVDLNVKVWMLVEQKIPFTAKIKEVIYDALNEHGIEIPFPQRDLHIINPKE